DISGGVISNFVASSGVVGTPSVTYNGTQGFAIDFDFPNNPGPNFTTGEAVSFDLSAAASLTVAGFNVLGGGPTGDDDYAGVHISGAGGGKLADLDGGKLWGNDNNSGFVTDAVGDPVTIPQPGTASLIGLGLLGAGVVFRRRQSAK